MALTPVTVARNSAAGVSLQVPRQLGSAAIAVTTASALGLAFSQANTEGPAATCSFSADADTWFSDQDSLAVANMRKLPAGSSYQFQVTPGQTVNFYIKCAATANVIPFMEG